MHPKRITLYGFTRIPTNAMVQPPGVARNATVGTIKVLRVPMEAVHISPDFQGSSTRLGEMPM
jgi:hypothetical protein